MNKRLKKKRWSSLDSYLYKELKVNDRLLHKYSNVLSGLDSINKSLDYFVSIDDNFSSYYIKDLQVKDHSTICHLDFHSFTYKKFEPLQPDFCFLDSETKQINFLEFKTDTQWDFKCWSEFNHRLLSVSELNSSWFLGDTRSIVADLQKQIRLLRQKLRQQKSKKTLEEIRRLIVELKELVSETYHKTKYRSQNIQVRFASLKRNLRMFYRQIIQFLFKNLDDESGDVENAIALKPAALHFQTFLNKMSNDRQRKMDSNLRCRP